MNPETEEKLKQLEEETLNLAREEVEREEQKAKEMSGGQTAGHRQEEKKDLTPKEYADSLDKGIIPEKKLNEN